jgi:hypothetical protein
MKGNNRVHTELAYLRAALAALRERIARLHGTGDAGYTAEAVVVIALLVAMAIAAIALITSKVLAKAGSLNLG